MDKITALQEVLEAMTPDQLQTFEKEHKILLTFLIKMGDEALTNVRK